MSLSLTQNLTAIVPNMTAIFLAAGGIAPYTYSVRANGAGGVIDPVLGNYTAPALVNDDPQKLFDTIQVADITGATATARIMVGTPLLLFCDIIQSEMNLSQGRVYLWDQKIMQPTDFDLYIAVSVMTCKPFSNITRFDGSGAGLNSVQTVNMMATLDIDILSRGPAALNRKEEVIAALGSVYSEQQQEANSFYIAKLPPGSRFLNLSAIDGAAIPYRFKISINMQYAVTKIKAVPYFDTFSTTQLTTEA